MAKRRFSAVQHIPKYSLHLFDTLTTPAVVYFAIVGNVILFTCITLFYNYEFPVNSHVNTWLDAFWWGVVTITTVGYGDITPVTTEGRVIALVLIMLGVTFFVSFTALFISVLFNSTSEELNETQAETHEILRILNRLEKKIDNLEK